jgi:ClpP class serine protease
VGSIGTIGILVDDSEMFRQLGIKVLPITTGINKAAGIPGVPVAAEHVVMVQGIVDLAQLAFESAVERGRKLKPDQLHAVTDGSVWTAGQARRLKLIDSVALSEDRYAEIEDEYPAEPFAALMGRAAAEKFEQLALAACKLDEDDDISFVPESVLTKLRAEHPMLAAAASKFNSERPTYGRRYS